MEFSRSNLRAAVNPDAKARFKDRFERGEIKSNASSEKLEIVNQVFFVHVGFAVHENRIYYYAKLEGKNSLVDEELLVDRYDEFVQKLEEKIRVGAEKIREYYPNHSYTRISYILYKGSSDSSGVPELKQVSSSSDEVVPVEEGGIHVEFPRKLFNAKAPVEAKEGDSVLLVREESAIGRFELYRWTKDGAKEQISGDFIRSGSGDSGDVTFLIKEYESAGGIITAPTPEKMVGELLKKEKTMALNTGMLKAFFADRLKSVYKFSYTVISKQNGVIHQRPPSCRSVIDGGEYMGYFDLTISEELSMEYFIDAIKERGGVIFTARWKTNEKWTMYLSRLGLSPMDYQHMAGEDGIEELFSPQILPMNARNFARQWIKKFPRFAVGKSLLSFL